MATAAVEQGGGQLLVAQDLDSFDERAVGGADEDDPLTALDGFHPVCDRDLGHATADRSGDYGTLAALDTVEGGS